MLQHAVHSVPDRAHGYCVDDNARALLLSCALASSGEAHLSETLTARFAAFIQHAWNPDTGRFRNFMSYDRRWLEATGSEDSHGRTLWALAECARNDIDPSRRRWAAALFKTALPAVEDFSSPRAWAFSLLGLDAYCALGGGDRATNPAPTSGRPIDVVALGYENQRLALVRRRAWLRQCAPSPGADSNRTERPTRQRTSKPACDRCAGSCRFRPRPRDASDRSAPRASAGPVRNRKRSTSSLSRRQQRFPPALLRGGRDGGAEWPAGAMRAFAWFLGENDLQTTLIDPETGSCSDGLHPDRPNENKGAESALSYLLGLVEIRQLERTAMIDRTRPASKLVRSAEHRIDRSANDPREPSLSQSQFLTARSCICAPTRPGSSSGPSSRRLNRRDLNPTDKTRANHIVDRVLRLEPEVAARQLHRSARELRRSSPEPARYLRDARRGDGRGVRAACALNKTQRRLIGAYFLHEYSFEASALFNPSIVRHPDQIRCPEKWLSVHPEPSRRRRRAYFVADVPVRHHRRGRERRGRSDCASRVGPEGRKANVRTQRRRCRSDLSTRRRTQRTRHLSGYRRRSPTASRTLASSSSTTTDKRRSTRPTPPIAAGRSAPSCSKRRISHRSG